MRPEIFTDGQGLPSKSLSMTESGRAGDEGDERFGDLEDLGRGLSALLGEPVKTDFGTPNRRRRTRRPGRAAAEAHARADRAAAQRVRAAGDQRAATPHAATASAAARTDASARRWRSARRCRSIWCNAIRASRASISTKANSTISPTRSARMACCSRSWCARSRAADTRSSPANAAGARRSARACTRSPRSSANSTKSKSLEIAIVENVQRTDLNPIEEAQGFQALIDRFGRTQQEIADAVGKSRPHIANMLRLLQLPEDLQEMVRDGRLTSGHARAILTAPDPRGSGAARRSAKV